MNHNLCKHTKQIGRARKNRGHHRSKADVQARKGAGTEGPVRMQLDPRTVITCKPGMVAWWQGRYPNAHVIK